MQRLRGESLNCSSKLSNTFISNLSLFQSLFEQLKILQVSWTLDFGPWLIRGCARLCFITNLDFQQI